MATLQELVESTDYKKIIERRLAKIKEKERREKSRKRKSVFPRHYAKRYSDARTKEGRHLKAVVDGIVEDLGGRGGLTTAQVILLDRVREKLIVLMQIGSWVDKQEAVVSSDGELPGCLGKNYTNFSESIRRDLLALNEMSAKRPVEKVDLVEYLRQKKESGEGPGD